MAGRKTRKISVKSGSKLQQGFELMPKKSYGGYNSLQRLKSNKANVTITHQLTAGEQRIVITFFLVLFTLLLISFSI